MVYALAKLALALSIIGEASAADWLSPPYTWLYQFPLPIPEPKKINQTVKNPVNGKDIRYYEIEIKEFSTNVYPDRGNATLVGYDGVSPGPTFMMEKDVEAVVRFVNKAKPANSVHLHGSYSRAPWDGWAEDVTKGGEYKDYYYPNSQNARTLWYHDHAIDHTAENAYFGQAGVYLLHDEAEDALNLPKGKYDVPLVLAAKQYNKDGSLFSPALETTSLYGDIIHVNGQPWPYMKVEPRKYRFRFLDASISRSFKLYFEKDKAVGTKLDFNVIASDAGLLSSPQPTKDLYISMAERYEIVMDFSGYKGQNVTLRNTRAFAADVDFLHTDKVMKFIVDGNTVSDDSVLPSKFRTIPYPTDTGKIDHSFKFERQNGHWTINGVTWKDVNNRVLAKPARGRVEVWELINTSGGWSHPIHVHLVDMKVLKRTGGRAAVMNYEAAGLKDVVWLGPGETVLVEANYAPWDGLYMFHCHNLIHEDHEMMAAFNVSVLPDLGYKETLIIDPMNTDYRAVAQKPADFESGAIEKKVQSLANLQPYRVADTEKALDDYYATHAAAAPPAAATTPSSPGSPTTLATAVKPSTTVAAAAATTSDSKGRGGRAARYRRD
ncbi:Cupredoxin [Plectosphaerella plurivora]|uniref:Cupredoxin n=1 Tax=Plectosphaerella plurivora TaxID=936078 RepID=A0A9P8VHV1_9PEZI|nr:Cupredoxin [Plectosphaerella plurivora]